MSLKDKKRARDVAESDAKEAAEEYARHKEEMKSLKEKLHSFRERSSFFGSAARLRQSCAIRLLLKSIEKKENELDDASALRDGKESLARASTVAFNAALLREQRASASSSSGLSSTAPLLERPLKRPRTEASSLPLPTWTTGKIYSDSAKYWKPQSNGWIDGYAHASDPRRTQRFVFHLDTGNSGPTCIMRSTFEFLGLSQILEPLRQTRIVGVNGQSKLCPVYQIKFSLDLANQAHPERDHIYQRTVEAAVIEGGSTPDDVGHHDLLVNAEDVRKFLNLNLPGDKKFRLEVLGSAPTTLYDRQQLKLRERFSTPPPEPVRPPRPGLHQRFQFPAWPDNDFSMFRDFPGFLGQNRHVGQTCKVA
eukprot:TRINITY_DN96264_c0_g1_i1.p1 TRINITY_DN96264_c0_g1~~TRINITY_DN96264_c0_g1_i1.p1  ORF type:complete len:365 (+),score=59.34 TRINITY_DN96264_c0_g1_i1:48-1142(+)